MCTTQCDKLSIAQKKKMKALNGPENLTLDLYLDEDEDDLPTCQQHANTTSMPTLTYDEEEGKSEPEETIAGRVKLNPRKRKKAGTGKS